jgi:predicted transcriptional regulator of viral defense system
LPWFDLATVMQLSGEKRASVITQLSRWTAADKVVSLRRGMYALGENYQKKPLQPAALANAVYAPSYLSCLFALSFYGIIPESVPVFTSVTTRKPRTFENRFGTFDYRNIKRDLFFGYNTVMMTGQNVRMATPEKALVDYWHLTRGEWTAPRLVGLRISPESPLDMSKLGAVVRRFDKPRISRAHQRLIPLL